MTSTLYITPTPIGNFDDITIRALDVMRRVDFIICEEFKPARKLLAHFEIEMEVVSLNEHNEKEISDELAQRLLNGESAALISDGGTPLFSDPGNFLVDLCISYRIKVIPLPGANSLLPSLIASGLKIDKFYYYGWISPKKDIRREEFKKLKNIRELIVIMETPYRLKRIIIDVVKYFGPNQQIVLAFKLTMPEEKVYRMSAGALLKEVEKTNLKGEFVLLIENRANK